MLQCCFCFCCCCLDHDIFDGWGSYPDYLQRSAVFQGLFAVARRFYLLFQQHCRYDNATAISATLGDYSYHQVGRFDEASQHV